MRNDDIRDRLKVENITERCRKARLRWFGTRKEARPRICRKKDSGHGTTWEKKARKTEAEMDGLCQPGHESHQNDEVHDRTGWRRIVSAPATPQPSGSG